MPFRYAGQARFLNSTEFTPLYQEIYQDGDIVWIQDYYVVAANGAHIAAQLRIGVFLHIPFPSSELYRILTHREEILHVRDAGIGSYEDARHFNPRVLERPNVAFRRLRDPDHGSW